MITRLMGVVRFWYRFFVGDDWTIAAGVVLALAATYALGRTVMSAWWITPAVAVVLLAVSVRKPGG
jgi:uncharacterized membrane protein HdeD (DUF308 family)